MHAHDHVGRCVERWSDYFMKVSKLRSREFYVVNNRAYTSIILVAQ